MDDDHARVTALVGNPRFATSVEVRVVGNCDDALSVLTSDYDPELVILDVQGEDGSQICVEAGAGRLSRYPWLLVSDLARDEHVAKRDVLAVSRHFVRLLETAPERAGVVLGHVANELAMARPAPARPFISHTVHDARRLVENARWRLHEILVAGGRYDAVTLVGELDSIFEEVVGQLTIIQLQ